MSLLETLAASLLDSVIRLAVVWIGIFAPFYGLMGYVERKFSADLQARIGPSLVGPRGMFQGVADLIKLLAKRPLTTHHLPDTLQWLVGFLVLYSSAALLPLGSYFLLFDTELSLLLPLVFVAIASLSQLWLALSLGRVESWIGGIRMAAQSLVALFPAMLSILCVGVYVGSFQWKAIAEIQGFSFHHWTLFSSPFLFLAGIVFYLSGVAMFHLPPMDAAVGSQEMSGGVYRGIAGRALVFTRIFRFYGLFMWCVFAVGAFGGAWNLPEFSSDGVGSSSQTSLSFLEAILVIVKAFVLMVFLFWQSRVSPRLRVDHVTNFSWRVLVPLSLLSLLGQTLWGMWGNG